VQAAFVESFNGRLLDELFEETCLFAAARPCPERRRDYDTDSGPSVVRRH
jgi:hypothetical protein